MMQEKKRIVVKIGTSTLTHANGAPHLRLISRLARVIADIKNTGTDVILVTSGAIAVGAVALGYAGKPKEVEMKQACAAVGQCDLMTVYDRLFSEVGVHVAQVLVTRHVLEDEVMRTNAQNTIHKLLEYNVLPIVNENDSVAIEEVVYGDNDQMSAVVAKLCHADELIMLTDQKGLYDKDPSKHVNAKLIEIVHQIDDQIHALAKGASNQKGTGGMITKLQAAEIAVKAGIEVLIAHGERPEILYELVDGDGECTKFLVGSD